ncbi:DMT family transporter [Sphingomonas canadensis]|uniref:DMT family transporter n=1 Tax=Sphingomonas canadensis TaxID=1219257 RepID=A0ABW3H541_9SPHN|nr:DMT family transporter [Sphingomonas canadensis]MCW3836618.1 DMT family transporter [Sphingomonas canadensis]
MSARATPAIAFAAGTLGIALFSAMDALMKGMTIAMGVYNAMLWRFGAIFVMSAIVHFARRPKRPGRAAMRIHLIRGLVTVVMSMLFFWGLAYVPMAQAITLTYIAPLLALYLAAVLLKERIGGAVIGASLLACAGVGVILLGQTRAEMGDMALLGTVAIIGSAICYSWNIILMRQQALVADPAEIAFFQSMIVGGTLALAAPWLGAMLPADQIAPTLLAAVLATVSLFLLSWAYARAEAHYLAPTEYTSFVWAALLGWLVFGEHVSFYTLAGAGLIVAACLIAARRKPETMTHEAEAALP